MRVCTHRYLAPPPHTVAIAIVTTGLFVFVTSGETKTRAVDLMLAAWTSHAERYGIDPNYVTESDINVVEGPVGSAFAGAALDELGSARILPAGHGAHTDADHTRDAAAVGHDLADEEGLMICNDCLVPLYLCQVTGTYHHVDPTVPTCRYVRSVA